jgi:HEAT repeat protein
VGADAGGLRVVLRSGTTLERVAALVSVRPGPGVEAALVEALDDPERQVRAGAVRALAGLARARGTRALLRVTNTDPAPEVRAAAVAALAGILEQRIGPVDGADSS